MKYPLKRIIEAWGHTAPLIWQRMHFAPNHCLNGTRVTIDAFKHFKYEPKPISVGCVAMNEIWAREIERTGHHPSSQEESDAWAAKGGYAVGIDTIATIDGQWAGHLVCHVGGWMLDSSAEQFARPSKRINVSDVIAGEIQPGFLDGNVTQSFVNTDGSRLIYNVRDDRTFIDVPGFQRSPWNKQATGFLITAMTRFLGGKNNGR